jgi:hypothetical protein
MLGSCARAFAPHYLIDNSEYSNVDAKQIFPDQLLKVLPISHLVRKCHHQVPLVLARMHLKPKGG